MNTDLDALLNKDQADDLTAYRDCLIVMLHCAPLHENEILSITPDTAEVWLTTNGSKQHYGWRYNSSKTRFNANRINIILIPDSLALLAQKAIVRLRELYSEHLVKNYQQRCNSDPELRIDFKEYRKHYVETYLEHIKDINSTGILEYFRHQEHIDLSQYYPVPNSTLIKPYIDES